MPEQSRRSPEYLRREGQDRYGKISRIMGYDGVEPVTFKKQTTIPTNGDVISLDSDNEQTDKGSTGLLEVMVINNRAVFTVRDIRDATGQPIPVKGPEIKHQLPDNQEVVDRVIATLTEEGESRIFGVDGDQVVELGFDEMAAADFIEPCMKSVQKTLHKTCDPDSDPFDYMM